MSAFGVDTREDVADRHPSKLCSCCSKFVQHACSAGPSSHVPQTAVVPVDEWPACDSDSCVLCQKWKAEVSRVGRPPKSKGGIRGRPKGGSQGSSKACVLQSDTSSVVGTASAQVKLPDDVTLTARVKSFRHDLPLLPERFVRCEELEEDQICPVCKNVLDRPVAVPVPGCEHACCVECWEQWLTVSGTCPVCRTEVAVQELQPLPRASWLRLTQLEVHCDNWASGCDVVLPLSLLREHAASCSSKLHGGHAASLPPASFTLTTPVPSHFAPAPAPLTSASKVQASDSVSSIISAPVTQPISPLEDRLLGGLLRRLKHQHQTSVGLPVFTGGRRTHVSITPVGDSTATTQTLRTKQRRHNIMCDLQELVCGGPEGASVQLQYDIARKSQQERENLLVQANINYYAQPGETVALACNLRLSNEQLRKLRSWTKKWNLHLASERKTRSLAVEQTGDIAIGSELVQAVQHGEDVTRSLRPAAYTWVKNLQTLIESHLSSLAKRNLLTWHEH